MPIFWDANIVNARNIGNIGNMTVISFHVENIHITKNRIFKTHKQDTNYMR